MVMKTNKEVDNIISNIDDYISSCEKEFQPTLSKIREVIKQTAPEATEAIKYGMPAFVQNGVLVYFAACKKHIGFYPTPSALNAFKDELAGYKGSKGAVQFPINQPMPFELIRKMTEFRVMENNSKKLKKKARNLERGTLNVERET
jgi:uncharacterized protein YdhG (YjbR/CyaY superfamily)